MKQALKLLTFRPVTPFVAGAAASWSPGHGCPPSPRTHAAQTGTGSGRPGQLLPRLARGVCHPKERKHPQKDPPCILKCQHRGHSDPHRAQLGRLPSQEQEEGWQPLSTRNKALGETAEARFLTFLVFPRQRPRGSGWIRQQRTNSCLPWRLSFSPLYLPCNWMPPNTSNLLKPNPRSPLPPPSPPDLSRLPLSNGSTTPPATQARDLGAVLDAAPPCTWPKSTASPALSIPPPEQP